MTAPAWAQAANGGGITAWPMLTRDEADGRYVARFVTIGGAPVLAGNTRTQVNQAGVTESVLENPTGVVQGGGIPADASPPGFLENLDGGRFGQRVKIARIGNVPVLAGIRAEGTWQAPTPPLSGAVLFQINARPVTDAGTGLASVVSSVVFVARENIGPAAWGSLVRVQAGRVGAGVVDSLVDWRSGGAGIAEEVPQQAIYRVIPGATAYVIRDNASTFDSSSFNAAGTSIVLAASPTTADLSLGSGTGTGNTNFQVRGAAGTDRNINWMTGTSLRWIFRADNVAEGGANAGSNFGIHARTDAGGAIDSPFTIIRAANGAITLGGAGNRQVIIAGNAWGAGNASLRFNGLTNGAGALAGTLNNSPVAGNPAFWLPVNIAGTVRYIPCW